VRTLLIDYDPGPQGASARLGAKPRAPASGNDHDAATSLLEQAQPVIPGRLDVLTLDPSAPSGLAGDEIWSQAFTALHCAYQVILVDCGSAQGPLPLRWSRQAHLCVLVLDTTRTTEEELQRAKEEFDALGQRVDAVILNKRRYYVPDFLYRYVR